MKARKKLVSMLLAGSMMLFTACCCAESAHQIEKQTTPIYYTDMEPENKGEVDLFFVDGVKDVPYITVETAKDILVSNVRKLDAPNYDLTVKKDGEKIEAVCGCLEQENERVNILDIIASNMDGGKDSIEKRLRVYG